MKNSIKKEDVGAGGLVGASCRSAHEYLRADFFFFPTSMASLVCSGGALHCTHLSESVPAMIGLRPAGVLRSSRVAL